MLVLLHNIEPNAGANIRSGHEHGVVDWGIFPKVQQFSGKLKDGYSFLQSFKSIMNNSPNKLNTFGALLNGEVSSWFHAGNFRDWEEVEEQIIKPWSVILTSAEALVKAGKTLST